MTEIEAYEFDRNGYLVIPGLLTRSEVEQLRVAVDKLEAHAAEWVGHPPLVRGGGGQTYHQDPELGYHASGGQGQGDTLIIEDFWNADKAFDVLLDHAPTNRFIEPVIQGYRYTINNSEIRLRYRGNSTGTHMGGPLTQKYRYGFKDGKIDCMMVRMIYFLHDVDDEQGPFCVVPGTHKTNCASPYRGCPPEEEPGMIGLSVHAGDGIFFTENLRHGGFKNRKETARKTIHVGYGPSWMLSQNFATMDKPQYILNGTLARLDERQRRLVSSWPIHV